MQGGVAVFWSRGRHMARDTSLPVETSDEYSKRKIDFRGLGQHLRGRTLTSVCEALGCISIKYKNKRKMGPRTVALCKLMEQACPR